MLFDCDWLAVSGVCLCVIFLPEKKWKKRKKKTVWSQPHSLCIADERACSINTVGKCKCPVNSSCFFLSVSFSFFTIIQFILCRVLCMAGCFFFFFHLSVYSPSIKDTAFFFSSKKNVLNGMLWVGMKYKIENHRRECNENEEECEQLWQSEKPNEKCINIVPVHEWNGGQGALSANKNNHQRFLWDGFHEMFMLTHSYIYLKKIYIYKQSNGAFSNTQSSRRNP